MSGRTTAYPFQTRLHEAFTIMEKLPSEGRNEIKSTTAKYILALYDDCLLAYGHLKQRPLSIQELPELLDRKTYDGLTLIVGDHYKTVLNGDHVEAKIGLLFPLAALSCLHPDETDPINVAVGQAAASICDEAVQIA